MIRQLPAWSLHLDAVPTLSPVFPREDITADWAWGESSGLGVKVAVIDSGIDAAHPAVRRVHGYASIDDGPDGQLVNAAPHEDLCGHGTACAGIVRAVAPDCELYSVRVLGSGMSGSGSAFAGGLRWAIENSMQVANLSLGTTRKEFFGVLHELADDAYFRNVILVSAANNLPVPTFPSLYASVISVASHEGKDNSFYCNPRPPVEFYAPGVDVRVAWLGGGWLTVTGNSFAAPHISGLVARILAKHPGATVSEMKVILRALAANVLHEGNRTIANESSADD